MTQGINTFATQWAAMEENLRAADISQQNIRIYRGLFYTGAIALMQFLDNEDSTEVDIEGVIKELQTFSEQVRADLAKAGLQ